MASDGVVDTYDLVIQQGQPLNRTFTLTDSSTGDARTGLTLAEARIKPRTDSSTVLLDLDAYLSVNAGAGTITLAVSKAIVDTLTFKSPAVWDMFATLDGAREKLFTGTVTLKPNVTD